MNKSIEKYKNTLNKNKLISKLAINYIGIKIFYKILKYKNKLKKSLLIPEVKSILVIRIGSIGDTIRTTSVIEKLKEQNKNSSIDILTSKQCAIIFKNNININNIYFLEDIDNLSGYDWIINLQYFPMHENFITNEINSYEILLSKISKIPNKFITGNILNGSDIKSDTNILYNTTSQEQLYDIALLDWDENSITESKIYLNPNFNSENLEVIRELKKDNNIMGIFLGSYSVGDYDNGFRSYSIDYILNLIKTFYQEYKIVLFGQSNTKTEHENDLLRLELKKYKNVVNIIDKTNLEELIYIINEFNILITSDSGPLHIGIALDVKTIGLFGNAGTFEISPKLDNNNFSIVNSFEPCSKYNYEWKFFCQECLKTDSEKLMCNMHNSKKNVDNIDIEVIKRKINHLLN